MRNKVTNHNGDMHGDAAVRRTAFNIETNPTGEDCLVVVITRYRVHLDTLPLQPRFLMDSSIGSGLVEAHHATFMHKPHASPPTTCNTNVLVATSVHDSEAHGLVQQSLRLALKHFIFVFMSQAQTETRRTTH